MSNVIGVYSRKARGFAVPVDLLRVVCRVKSRCAVRGRVASAFSGYLVTDPEALPVWKMGGRVVLLSADPGRQYVRGLVDRFERIFAMDATDYLPAGSTLKYAPDGVGEVCAVQRTKHRAGWYE